MRYLNIIFTLFLFSCSESQENKKSNLQLDHINSELSQINKTKVLDTLILKSTSLPSIDSIKDVVYLQLYNPEFGNLPKEIAQMKKLRYIGLATNALMNDIPKEIGQLKKLEEINFIKPLNISHFPEAICQLTQLKRLTIAWGSNLENIPESIGYLKHLKLLDLGRNKIQCLPESIAEIESLDTLVLWDNPIPEQEKERIKKMLPSTAIFFDKPLNY